MLTIRMKHLQDQMGWVQGGVVERRELATERYLRMILKSSILMGHYLNADPAILSVGTPSHLHFELRM